MQLLMLRRWTLLPFAVLAGLLLAFALHASPAGAAVPADCSGLGPDGSDLSLTERTDQYLSCTFGEGPLENTGLVVTELEPYWAVNQSLMFPAPQREYRRYGDGAVRFTPYTEVSSAVWASHACANGRTVKVYPDSGLQISLAGVNSLLDRAGSVVCGSPVGQPVVTAIQDATTHTGGGDTCPALFSPMTDGGGYPEVCMSGSRASGGMLLFRYRGATWWPTISPRGYAQGPDGQETITYDSSGARVTRHTTAGTLVMMTGVCNDQFFTLENSWPGSFNWGNYEARSATEPAVANAEMEAVFGQELTRRCPNGSERSKVVTVEQLTRVPGFDAKGADILRLYFAFFSRDPDLVGAKYWLDEAVKGLDLDDAAWGFSNSDEFRAGYGTELTDRQYLELIYNNVLGRGSDPEGLAYWLGELEAERITRAGTVRWIAANAEFVNANPYPAPASW